MCSDKEWVVFPMGSDKKQVFYFLCYVGKQVKFLEGADKKEWVWVMGEHKNDKTIEEILEQESVIKANKEAENEARKLR